VRRRSKRSKKEPWEGKSPRDLTKGAKLFRFREPPANASGVNHPKRFGEQLELEFSRREILHDTKNDRLPRKVDQA